MTSERDTAYARCCFYGSNPALLGFKEQESLVHVGMPIVKDGRNKSAGDVRIELWQMTSAGTDDTVDRQSSPDYGHADFGLFEPLPFVKAAE